MAAELGVPPNLTAEIDVGGADGRIGSATEVKWLERLGFDTQVGPLYLGLWGTMSFVFGGLFTFVWLMTMLVQVNYNPIAFLKYFAVLQLDPPSPAYGLGFAPLDKGGWWLVATACLTVSLVAWLIRVWERARALGLKPYLAYGFTGAIALYLVIYLIRPIIMGTWAEAPSHGIKALLDWDNNTSVRYGNFYYNPFHMLSIFFLLGSTLLFSMHGATVWALEKFGAHEEEAEIIAPGTGTERAQLFWRWTMGFNANAYSIHLWAFWFAWLCPVTGAIGVLLSGTLVTDWFQWAVDAGINYPQAPPVPVELPLP